MKNKSYGVITSLLIGSVLFVSSSLNVYASANAYEKLKKAVYNSITDKQDKTVNYDMEYFVVDGDPNEVIKVSIKSDLELGVKSKSLTNVEIGYKGKKILDSMAYMDENVTFAIQDGNLAYHTERKTDEEKAMAKSTMDSYEQSLEQYSGLFDYAMNYMLGDHIANFVYKDNKVTLKLVDHQIPEIINLGIENIKEEMLEYGEEFLVETKKSGFKDYEEMLKSMVYADKLRLTEIYFSGELTKEGNMNNVSFDFTFSAKDKKGEPITYKITNKFKSKPLQEKIIKPEIDKKQLEDFNIMMKSIEELSKIEGIEEFEGFEGIKDLEALGNIK